MSDKLIDALLTDSETKEVLSLDSFYFSFFTARVGDSMNRTPENEEQLEAAWKRLRMRLDTTFLAVTERSPDNHIHAIISASVTTIRSHALACGFRLDERSVEEIKDLRSSLIYLLSKRAAKPTSRFSHSRELTAAVKESEIWNQHTGADHAPRSKDGPLSSKKESFSGHEKEEPEENQTSSATSSGTEIEYVTDAQPPAAAASISDVATFSPDDQQAAAVPIAAAVAAAAMVRGELPLDLPPVPITPLEKKENIVTSDPIVDLFRAAKRAGATITITVKV